MIIGTHELRGIVVKLTQPFVVLQKSVGAQRDTNATIAPDSIDNASTTAYHMVGVVRYKLLFNQYPKTIMR
jgi:Ctf8